MQGAARSHMSQSGVPIALRCEICQVNLAPERHFVTVPLPQGFSRICDEDFAEIKMEIRSRVKKIVAGVFAEAKVRQLKELLKQ